MLKKFPLGHYKFHFLIHQKKVMFFPIPSIFALVGILLSQQNSVHCATANVNLAGVRQTIQGFGASSAWQGRASDNAMNSLFANGNNNQIGLSIIRLRIDPNKNWGDEISNAQKATSRGAQVMATPWTAPAWMKTSNNVNGGSLKTDQYQAYADHLNSFVQQLRNSGVQLYAISVQNEPDIKVTYESMDWNPSQMVTFLKNFGSRIQGTKIMAAESFQFRKDITDAILNDPSAASKVAIIAGHIYGGGLGSYPLAKQKGKQLWMTEHFNDGWDWASCMQTAKEIHDSMTIAEYNAYFLWWFKNEKNSLGPLDGNGNPTIRAYVIGQWSKYVRPGFVRVDATYTPSNGVFISAFKNGNKVVIVAVNMGDTVSQQFSIGGGPIPSTFTPHISSEWKKISNEANVNVANGSFTYTLQAKSVTTFVSN